MRRRPRPLVLSMIVYYTPFIKRTKTIYYLGIIF